MMTSPRAQLVLGFSAFALTAALIPAVVSATEPRAGSDRAYRPNVEHGASLVRTMGCNDCHTPWKIGPKGPEMDMTRALTGHPQDLKMPPAPQLPEGPWIGVMSATNTAWAGPWGVSFTANLTPDKETGLGNWSVADIVKAIRTGVRPDGRGLVPIMPWPAYAKLTQSDAEAIAAYLKSLPAVRNQVPGPFGPSQTPTSFVMRVVPPAKP
jgi:mono/diheme cytochrome c family protein